MFYVNVFTGLGLKHDLNAIKSLWFSADAKFCLSSNIHPTCTRILSEVSKPSSTVIKGIEMANKT